MSLLTDLQAQVTELQAQIAILTSVGEDVFSFGTIMNFAYANNAHVYYVKTGEEAWRKLGSNTERPLREWILLAKQDTALYFEVHQMSVLDPAHPFYASA